MSGIVLTQGVILSYINNPVTSSGLAPVTCLQNKQRDNNSSNWAFGNWLFASVRDYNVNGNITDSGWPSGSATVGPIDESAHFQSVSSVNNCTIA